MLGIFKRRHPVPEPEYEVWMNSEIFRMPLAGLRPKDYLLPPEYTGLQKELDEHLNSLFQGQIDAGNETALDNFIIDAANRAREDLNRQYVEHISLIRNLGAVQSGEMVRLQRECVEYREQLEQTEAELKRLTRRAAGQGKQYRERGDNDDE